MLSIENKKYLENQKEKFVIKVKQIYDNKYEYNFETFKGMMSNIEAICPIHGKFYVNCHDHCRSSEHNRKECPECMKVKKQEKSTGKLTLAETTEKEESRKHVEETAVPASFAGTYEMKGEYEVENSQNIRIYLRAETEDGFVFEYDLFNATTVSALVESTIDEDKDATGFETKANYFAGNYSVYDSKGAKYEKN